MRRLPAWLDGMRARIAAVVLVALLVQFVGGEIIFSRLEMSRMQRNRAERLVERLAIAEEFLAADPSARTTDLLHRLWRNRLVVALVAAPSPNLASIDNDSLPTIRSSMTAARPELQADDVRLRRQGNALEGAVRLENGKWLWFRSEGHFEGNAMWLHYAASVLLLIVCVALIALLFGRMIGRPLRQIVDAAETAGRDEPVAVTVDGPREVRQVATAFERLQTRLLAHLRDRVQSLAAMSHDLRTPLARLQLNASTVTDAETRTALQTDIREMEGFVASILDYLRGEEAEIEQRVDIASILMTIVDEIRDEGGDVDYRGPDRLEAIVRPLKLKRLVRNIVQNAHRHAGNAIVLLGTADADADIIITVLDDGPGIAEDDQERVFEPFTRLEIQPGSRGGGAGLGMAIAKRLVDRLGGMITLANRPEGGLAVTIRLPLGLAVATLPSTKGKAPPRSNGQRNL